ncbi:T9SS type A sorting domain-containing protein [Cochleicola gelatinilyticus]|uniref:Secretion system C-terminal sorting domain-containing protein n=1 Tax=Cochleicola gelatinilyticus TaxID=1763537 RepID=A0A167ERL8_9FLAO|nr:T9SS type A sorting domain-containing protein [Cochleicola gelatinilyticus]OAB75811.1 hypothetical protein ULVI_15150 [Cochleicola gelatinilyticus]
MKKVYLLALAAGLFSMNMDAQIIDDSFEDYSIGQMGAQNTAVWSVWSGTPTGPSPEDISVTDEESLTGDQSGLIGAGAPETGGPQDALLLLGNLDSGTYTLDFQLLIPESKTAYFNIQGTTENGGANGGTGVFNSGNITFNLDGTNAGIVEDIEADGTVNGTYTYPEDEWFPVSIFFDLDATPSTYVLSVNGLEGPVVAFGGDNVLGGIDFFAIDPNNEYYVDDVLFDEGTLGTSDFSSDVFSVYPNPVKNNLQIRSAAPVELVTVYDVLGKAVLNAKPDAISPSIDMSGLSSGAYLVKVTIGGTSKTIKVIK